MLIKQGFILNVTSNGCLFSISNEIIFFGIFNNSLLTLSQSDNILYINKKRKRDEINNTFLWHCRLGHISETKINKLYKEKFFDPYDYESLGTCDSCLMGKMTKTPWRKDKWITRTSTYRCMWSYDNSCQRRILL